MKLTDFDYHLPPESIAQFPAEPRDSAKLLRLNKDTGKIEDKVFSDILELLWENDVLVINKTRVINARLKWEISGIEKECEIFLHKKISDSSWDCLVYPGKKLKPGTQVHFLDPNTKEVLLEADITGISEKGRIVEFSRSGDDFLNTIGIIWEVPLPPYIKDRSSESERYQTVYNDSQKSWSVAAPTAGLHFTPELLEKLQEKWVRVEKVLLHVWLGTFMNVDVEDIKDHHMHSEYIELDEQTAQRLNAYKKEGKRIIAVGTTSVRTLESFAASQWILTHGNKETDIFIYPGYDWKFVDSIITNFHLPKSTLLMLVSSFAWSENIKKAYEHAVSSDYRFFSFGDAMFLE